MNLLAATFDEDSSEASLATITVRLTAAEAALLAAFTSQVAPKAVTEASNIEWGNLMYDLADDLSSIGNTFYEAGWGYPRWHVALSPRS